MTKRVNLYSFIIMSKACHECSLSSDMALCPLILWQAVCYDSLPPASLSTLLPLRVCAAFVNLSSCPPRSWMSVRAVGLQWHCLTGLCSSSHFNYTTATVTPTFPNDKWWIISANKNLWIIQNWDQCKLDGMPLNSYYGIYAERLHEQS